MMKLLAGAFAGFAAIFGGMFGGHATSTPSHMGMGSTSPMQMGTSTDMHGMRMGSTTPGMMGGMGVLGKVTAVNGTSLTVEGHGGGNSMATTTFTVDASNATVTKAGAASSVADIAVGDTVVVAGTVSGTTVTATKVMDGVMPFRMGGQHTGSTTPRSKEGKPPVASDSAAQQ